jgi:hypothetical protein
LVVLTINTTMATAWREAAMGRVPINDEMVQAASKLLHGPSAYRDTLRRIVDRKVKSVDVDLWRRLNGVTQWHLDKKQEKDFNAKLNKIRAMTDPAGNPNEHQRRVAEGMLAKLKAAGPPKAGMRSPPGLEEYDHKLAQSQAACMAELDAALEAAMSRRDTTTTKPRPALSVNTTKPKSGVNTTTKPRPKPDVNTTKAKSRSADRHLEPNRDRHSPGYMRDYMRRRRAAKM